MIFVCSNIDSYKYLIYKSEIYYREDAVWRLRLTSTY
jgi:hypothetical protein